MKNGKAGIEIFAPQVGFGFSLGLPDCIPIFEAELTAACRRPFNFFRVVLLADPLPVCEALASPCSSYSSFVFSSSFVYPVWKCDS